MPSGSAAQDSRADGFLARLFFPSGWRLGDGRRSLDRAGSWSLPATRTRCTTSSLRLSAMIASCGSSSTAEEIPGAIPNGSVGVFGGADLPLCQYPSSAAEGRIVFTLAADAAVGRTLAFGHARVRTIGWCRDASPSSLVKGSVGQLVASQVGREPESQIGGMVTVQSTSNLLALGLVTSTARSFTTRRARGGQRRRRRGLPR